MNSKTITILALVLIQSSCDKVKQATQKATSAVNQQLDAAAKSPVKSELQKLVDQTEEGVVFRKDLPFPDRVEVKTVRKREISARLFRASELGKKVESVNGTEKLTTQVERSGEQVTYKMVETIFELPVAKGAKEGPKKAQNPLQTAPPTKQAMSFRKLGNAWKYDGKDGFRGMVIAQQLAPLFDQLLIDQALAPRALWFSKARIPIGHEVDVADASISMLVAGKAKGSLHLKLESIEAVHEHPCGVFSVSGNYTRDDLADFEGNLTEEEVTVESGKLWLSLLYPIVLKEELNTIQTFKPSGDSAATGRCQGTIKLSVDREWKIPAPAAPAP